jgi:hypothetical protein
MGRGRASPQRSAPALVLPRVLRQRPVAARDQHSVTSPRMLCMTALRGPCLVLPQPQFSRFHILPHPHQMPPHPAAAAAAARPASHTFRGRWRGQAARDNQLPVPYACTNICASAHQVPSTVHAVARVYHAGHARHTAGLDVLLTKPPNCQDLKRRRSSCKCNKTAPPRKPFDSINTLQGERSCSRLNLRLPLNPDRPFQLPSSPIVCATSLSLGSCNLIGSSVGWLYGTTTTSPSRYSGDAVWDDKEDHEQLSPSTAPNPDQLRHQTSSSRESRTNARNAAAAHIVAFTSPRDAIKITYDDGKQN